MKVTIIGAGIIGAAIAYRLARGGAQVTIVDAGAPGQGASAASFGWLNASFFLNDDHFRLRVAALEAWRRLQGEVDLPGLSWPGCLCWEEQGDAFDRQRDRLRALGYPVEEVGANRIAKMEPGLADVPERALYFPREGAADLVACAQALIAASGARVLGGCRVQQILVEAGRVVGVEVEGIKLASDHVVIAAGTGAGDLAATAGVHLPMLDRPGLMMRTCAVEPVARHILVAPGQELRQLPDGRLLAPTTAAHQSDASDRLAQDPAVLATAAMERVQRLFGRPDLDWAAVHLAGRPMPRDGLPVIGAAGPEGLYVAVMHSGATLGALAGEIAAAEITGVEQALGTPYRVQRFAV